MYALDFEYDGRCLSDFGFIICDFNSPSGANIMTAGSKITFNTVSHHKGKKYSLVDTPYDECIQTTFDICKNPDIYDDLRITDNDYRDLMRWLNRKEFLKFQIIEDELFNERGSCYYKASFNVEKIKIREILYGLELTMETNKPFGYGQEQHFYWDFSNINKSYLLRDISDEIGFTYPSMIITCIANGDLKIVNETENCTMKIENCRAGEVITIDGESQIFSSSYNDHDIYNDFNYEFLKIGNTIKNRYNKISVSLPCKLEIKYNPVIKDSP